MRYDWINNVGNETLLTILVTIAIFFLGIIFQAIWHSFSAYLNRRKIRRMFSYLLKEFVKDTAKQAQNMRKNAEQFTFENRKDFYLANTNITSSAMIQEIGIKSMHEAYFVGLEYYLTFVNRHEYHQKYMTFIKNTIDADFWHEKTIVDTFAGIDKYNKYHDVEAP